MKLGLVVGKPAVGKTLLVTTFNTYIAQIRRRRSLGRRRPPCKLVDTVALTDTVQADAATRKQQGRLLLDLLKAPLVLHLIDTPSLGAGGPDALHNIDRELLTWGLDRPGYIVLAGRMDLPWALTGLAFLRQLAPSEPLAVSARTGLGFGELRQRLRC